MKPETRTKTDVLYDSDDWKHKPAPIDLIDHIAWLQAKLESIPEEYRESAYIIHSTEDSYGDWYVHTKICCDRPETEEERAAREEGEAFLKSENEKRERTKLQELLAKYPDIKP